MGDYEYYGDDDRSMFADPGGSSSLRRARRGNRRTRPCPTCGRRKALTPEDVRRGYQCDACAARREGGCWSN